MLLWITVRHAALAQDQRGGNRDGAYPAEKHQQREHHLAGRRQQVGDAGRQAGGTEGRNGFEDDLADREIGDPQQDDGAERDDDAAEHEDGNRLALGRGADAPAEGFCIGMSPRFGQHQQEQHHESADLDAARGAGAAAADEHQEVVQGPAFLGQRADVERVEAGGARRHRDEQAVQQLAGDAERADGARVAPFEQQRGEEAAGQQHQGAGQRQLGVQRPVARIAPAVAQVVQHGKTDAADDDRQHHRRQHQAVAGIAHQPVRMDREAGVVEGRDAVEQPRPEGLAPCQVVTEAQAQDQQRGDHELHAHRHHQHDLRHAGDVAQRQRARLGLGHDPGAQARRAVHHQAEQRGARHHAEAAHLEQQHDDGLAETRPVSAGVDHRQPDHADRRHGGEDGHVPGHGAAAGVGDRQHQQQRADRNGSEKSERHRARRVQDRLHGRAALQLHFRLPAPGPWYRYPDRTRAAPPWS